MSLDEVGYDVIVVSYPGYCIKLHHAVRRNLFGSYFWGLIIHNNSCVSYYHIYWFFIYFSRVIKNVEYVPLVPVLMPPCARLTHHFPNVVIGYLFPFPVLDILIWSLLWWDRRQGHNDAQSKFLMLHYGPHLLLLYPQVSVA